MLMDYFLHDKQIDCSVGSLQSCEIMFRNMITLLPQHHMEAMIRVAY